MATIRASCGDCGDVELTTGDVRVRVCTFDNRGTYSFRCPKCRMVVVKPAEHRTIDLLVASGVSMATCWTSTGGCTTTPCSPPRSAPSKTTPERSAPPRTRPGPVVPAGEPATI